MDILPEAVSQSIYVPYAATNYKTSATTQNQANYPDGDIWPNLQNLTQPII